MKIKIKTSFLLLLLIISINTKQTQQSNQANSINDIGLNKTIKKMKIFDSIFQLISNSKLLSNEAKSYFSNYKFAFYKEKTEFSNEEKIKLMNLLGKAYESYKNNENLVYSVYDAIKDRNDNETNEELSKTVIFLMKSLNLKSKLENFLGFNLDLKENLVKTMLEVNKFQLDFDKKNFSNQSRHYFKLLLSIIFVVVFIVFFTFWYVFSYNKKSDLSDL